MEHARLEVLLLKPLLEGVVVLRQLALGAAFAGFRLGDQFVSAGFVFSFGFTLALAQPGFNQDVIDDAADRDAEGLLQVPGVEDDLEISPQPLQIAGVDLRGGFVFQQKILAILTDDAFPARMKLREVAPVAGLTMGPSKVFSSATTSNSSAG